MKRILLQNAEQIYREQQSTFSGTKFVCMKSPVCIKLIYNHLRILSILFLLSINSCHSNGQVTLLREGIVLNNAATGTWSGDNIPRTQPTVLTYRNNSITSVNTDGYMVQAGDDWVGSSNNNLDGEIVTGNKLVWNGVDSPNIITHGLIVGYNINSLVKYNYIDRAPYGIIFKSGTETGENMTFTAGGCAYNICKNGKFAVRLKGINGVRVFNNTFYNENGSGWYFILITGNMDMPVSSPSVGTKIFNNIFYSTTQFPMIKIESGCFKNFECDYNVYWCTDGEPQFMIDGVTKTWKEWRALGYDAHSMIVNPNFNNTTNLVPTTRLDYGKNLGAEWQTGLSTKANWVSGTSPATAIQNGTWQVGARVFNTAIPSTGITVTGASGLTSITKDNGTLQLNASVLPVNASDKTVSWSIVNGTGQANINASGLVTAVVNGTVTAHATANDGSGVSGSLVITLTNQIYLATSFDGVENNDPFNISVTMNVLKIRFIEDFLSYRANLYNLQGILISGKIVERDSLSFDISRIPSGIYLLELSKGANKRVLKIFKP